MLYLTTYRSAHLLLNDLPYSSSESKIDTDYEVFYQPEKALKIWYIQNGYAVERSTKAKMDSLILEREEVVSLRDALETLLIWFLLVITIVLMVAMLIDNLIIK